MRRPRSYPVWVSWNLRAESSHKTLGRQLRQCGDYDRFGRAADYLHERLEAMSAVSELDNDF